METLKNFIAILTNAPLPLWAMLAGTLISWGFTQRVKRWLPYSCTGTLRHRLTQIIAFLAGAVATWAIIPGHAGIVAGILVGLWSPMTWRLAMVMLGQWRPAWRDALSGDVE